MRDKPKRWRAASDEVLQMARRSRREMTPAERILWKHLRGREFRRQSPEGRFILDFCAPKSKLAIEVDGSSHDGREEYDRERQAILEAQGWQFLRFSNEDVFKRLPNVLKRIEEALDSTDGIA